MASGPESDWWQPFAEPSRSDWVDLVEADQGAGALEEKRTKDVYGEPVEICYGPSGAPPRRCDAGLPAAPWEVWCETAPGELMPGPLLEDDGVGRGVWLAGHDALTTVAEWVGTLDALPGRFAIALEPQPDQLASIALFVRAVELCGGSQPRRGCLGFDPCSTLARDGWIAASAPRLAAQLAELTGWCLEHAPQMRGALVATAPFHDAGATPGSEVGWAIAAGINALRAMLDGGMPAEQAASQVLFSVDVGRDVLREVAKLRALRRLWLAVCRRAGVAQPGPLFWLHARTARRTKTLLEPWNNALRSTGECFAAVVGGARSLSGRAFDELTGGSVAGARLAVQTQHVLRDEVELHRAADPAAGSWAVEAWTEEISDRAWRRVRQVESRGGMIAALVSGWVAEQVAEEAAARRRQIVRRHSLITSVSSYPGRTEKLATRPRSAAARPLPAASRSCGGRAICTVDAIAAAEAGSGRPELAGLLCSDDEVLHTEPLLAWRDAEPIEEVRRRLETVKTGVQARLIGLGDGSQRQARLVFARQLLTVLGIDTAAGGDAARLLVWCGSDDAYGTLATQPVDGGEGPAVRLAVAVPGSAGADALQAVGVRLLLYEGVDLVELTGRILATLEGTR